MLLDKFYFFLVYNSIKERWVLFCLLYMKNINKEPDVYTDALREWQTAQLKL